MDKEKILKLISSNKTKEALKQLIESLGDQDLKIEVILLKRRLESLDQKVRLGVIDEKERNLEENKISHSTVSIINKIEFYEIEINDETVSEDFRANVKEQQKEVRLVSKPVKKNNKNIIKLILGIIGGGLVLAGLYWFFLYEKPVDCFDRLQIRNTINKISTQTEQFDKVHYATIDGFMTSFEKNKVNEDTIDIQLKVTVIFEKDDKKNNRDTLLNFVKSSLVYSSGNLHLEFKKGGEAYIFTEYETHYENRNSIHVVYASEPLNKLLIYQLSKKKFSDISFFNSMFSLNPRMLSSFLDALDNEESLARMSESVKCLINYEIE